MDILDIEIVKGFMRMCNDGWLQGWHERNGGNLTSRMKEEEVAQCRPFFDPQPFDIAFGLAHTIEKSAEIYVKVLSMGGGIIRQTITDDDLRAIARDFGVTLNEKFLNRALLPPPFFFILAKQASCPIPPNGNAGCLFCFMFPGTP